MWSRSMMNSRTSTSSLRATATLAWGRPPMPQREVGQLEVAIHAGGVSGRLAEDEAEECAALSGDVAEVIFVSGSVDGGGEADVADHVLAVTEAIDWSQHHDGGQRE